MKICANTCAEDALKAAELGADAVGFVFAPSSRRVTAAEVRAISEAMPDGVERVGVFGAGTVEEIAAAVEEARLHAVQLHGGLDLEFVRKLRGRLGAEIEVIQTLHWSVEDGEGSAERVRREMVAVAASGLRCRVLVDAKVGGASGGMGKMFDWTSAAAVLGSQPSLEVIVAGGLRPENVRDAIGVLRPWGVDVASGVEREPGRKDFGKLGSFMENARRA